MMNEKGQTLVIFIIILPLLLIILTMIVDRGYAYIEKRKIENYVKDAIVYRFKKDLEDEEIISEINDLFEKIKVYPNITILDNYIKIKVEKNHNSLFSMIMNDNYYKIKVSYVGTLENEKIVIRKG